MSRTIAELSPDTRVIAAYLSKLEPDQVVSWHDLAKLIGRSWERDSTYVYRKVRSAANIVRRDHSIVIDTVFNTGVKRLQADQVHTIGERTTVAIRRKARRATRTIIEGIRGQKLSNEAMVASNTQLAMLGVVSMVTDRKSTDKLTEAVRKHNNSELPPASALELFR